MDIIVCWDQQKNKYLEDHQNHRELFEIIAVADDLEEEAELQSM